MVRNLFLSQEGEISHATMTNTEGKRDGTVGDTLGEGQEECSVFSTSLELEQRSVHKKTASLTGTANEYKMREKNSEKKMDEEALDEMALQEEVKRSEEEVRRLECENK